MLVLGAAANRRSGATDHALCRADAGALPCPLTIVPGSLTDEEIDRMS